MGQKMEAEKGHDHDPETQIQSQQTNKQRANVENRGERDEKKETWKDELQRRDTKGRGCRWHHTGQMNSRPHRVMSFF